MQCPALEVGTKFADDISMASFNMRSFVLALGIAGIASGCDVGNNVPTGSDPDAPPAGVDAPVVATPKVAVTLDRATISTELLSSELITVTITGTGGFAGPVTLVATVVNAADNTPVVGATAVFSQPSVTLTANGSTVSAITVKLPNKAPAAVKVNVSATSSAPAADVSSALTVANQVTLVIKKSGNGDCSYADAPDIEIRVGTMMRFKAGDTIPNLVIHSEGLGQGVPHQQRDGDNTPNLALGDVYQKMSGPSVGAFSWYCHTPGPNLDGDMDPNTNNPRVSVVAL